MKEYLEQQLKKKAHELVLTVFRVASRAKGQKGSAFAFRRAASKIPAAIFEGQSREFEEDKVRYFTEAHNAVFEAKYYLDLLYNSKGISYYAYRQCANKLDLLDKMLISRIRSIDKRKAKAQYKTSIRTHYRNI